MALKIIPGMQLPHDAVDAEAYENLPKSLALLDKVSRKSEFMYLYVVQRIASEFPLLEGVEVEYCELFEKHVQASDLCPKDKHALKVNYCRFACCVILYPLPKLLISDGFDGLPEDVRDTALRHEMVHLEQLVRGDTWLTAEGGEGQYWKGEYYPIFDIYGGVAQGDAASMYQYLTLPWEREAYSRTEGEQAYLLRLQTVQCRRVVLEMLNILDEHHYVYNDEYVDSVCCAVQELIRSAQNHTAQESPASKRSCQYIVTAVEKLHHHISQDGASNLEDLLNALLNGDIDQVPDFHPDNQVYFNLTRAGRVMVDQVKG